MHTFTKQTATSSAPPRGIGNPQRRLSSIFSCAKHTQGTFQQRHFVYTSSPPLSVYLPVFSLNQIHIHLSIKHSELPPKNGISPRRPFCLLNAQTHTSPVMRHHSKQYAPARFPNNRNPLRPLPSLNILHLKNTHVETLTHNDC